MASPMLNRSTSELRSGSHGSTWFVPKTCSLPRTVVVQSLIKLSATELPRRPGMLREDSLRASVERLHMGLEGELFAKSYLRSDEFAEVLERLRMHTKRRWGEGVVNEGVVEWESTAIIYELFTMRLSILERIFFTTDIFVITSYASKFVTGCLAFTIFFSTAMWMLSTMPALQSQPESCVETRSLHVRECEPWPHAFFSVVERICVIIFSVEYMVRLLTVPGVRFIILDGAALSSLIVNGDGAKSHRGRCACLCHQETKLVRILRHVFGLSNLVDLFAILPFWMHKISRNSSAAGGALVVLRILRLSRVFRLVRLGKYSEQFVIVSRVLRDSLTDVAIMLVAICFCSCAFGMLLWTTEKGLWYPAGHPQLLNATGGPIEGRGAMLRYVGSLNTQEESPFSGIVPSIWLVIVSVSTVGYGDFAPATFQGKLVGSATILSGLIILAMPIAAIGTRFSREYYGAIDDKQRRRRARAKEDERYATEMSQDAALAENLKIHRPVKPIACELQRLEDAQVRILADAQANEEAWCNTLLSESLEELSIDLRRFCACLLAHEGPRVIGKPIVSVKRLGDLDELTTRVHEAIASATLFSFGSEAAGSRQRLGLTEIAQAHSCRRLWAVFCERCWIYAVEHCHIEALVDDTEYYQVKAEITRQILISIGAHEQPEEEPDSLDSMCWATPVTKSLLKPHCTSSNDAAAKVTVHDMLS